MGTIKKDTVIGDFPLKYFNLKTKAKIEICDLIIGEEIFQQRHINESWDVYYSREKMAIKNLEDRIFFDFIDKKFVFSNDVNKYDEKFLEFDFSGREFCGKIYRDGGGESLLCCNAKCFNRYLILSLFNGFDSIREKMRNTKNYIHTISKATNGKIYTQFWLARTGIAGRSKRLESLEKEEMLSFKTRHGFGYEVFDLNGNSLGDITFGNDRTPIGAADDNEYFEIYKRLEKDNIISLESIRLEEIIKHGNPIGRPRKALAKVLLEFNVDYKKLDELKMAETVDFENIANNMATLAMIDYNRKCDIIKGKIEQIYNYKELFSIKNIINIADYELLIDEQLDCLSINNFEFSLDELKSLWETIVQLECCQKNGNINVDDDISLYREDKYFLFHFYTQVQESKRNYGYKIKRLGIYKK